MNPSTPEDDSVAPTPPPAPVLASAPGVPTPPPKPAAAPTPPLPTMVKAGVAAGLVILLVVATLWYDQARDIAQLKRAVIVLQDSQRQLQARANAPAAPPTAVGQTLNLAGVPAKGGEQATVAFIEFSDYECPFCIRHFTQTMPLIETNYIATGKIRYFFRDLPIDALHPQSINAHVAAKCANEQHKFWDMHVRLFSSLGTHTPAQLEAKAAQSGLNIGAFKSCVATGADKFKEAIRGSIDQANALGVDATPGFMIGVRNPATDEVKITKTISGAVPYSVFQQAIDEALKKAGM